MKKKSLKNPKVKENLQALRRLYKDIPDTVGCMENINKEGGCGAWCCLLQCPPFLYIEFLNVWNHILNNWSTEKILDLIEKCIRTHISKKITKGCVLWDPETKLCLAHQQRPFNCRIYSITPDHEIKPRLEKFRKLYEKFPEVIIKDQCNLVKTADGSVVESTDQWWRNITNCEERIGIPASMIRNVEDGSYLLFHDHLLLHTCSDKALEMLPKTEAEIKPYMDNLRKNIQKFSKSLGEEKSK